MGLGNGDFGLGCSGRSAQREPIAIGFRLDINIIISLPSHLCEELAFLVITPAKP